MRGYSWNRALKNSLETGTQQAAPAGPPGAASKRSDAGGIDALDEHQLLAARVVGQGIRPHPAQRRRVDVQGHQVGVAGLKVGHLMQVEVLAAADVSGGKVVRADRLDPAVGD